MKSGADASAGTLGEQAQAFADRLTNSVHAVAAGCGPFTSRAMYIGDGPERFGVLQEPDTGVPLTVDGATLLTLKVKYFCTWDGHEQFLAIERSDERVFAGNIAEGEPLFRYDYVRKPGRNQPSAHVQVHAHRDAISDVMSKVGQSTRRARNRARSSDAPRVSELHFPVGGPRFRPCLEDVLEMLVCELGVDCSPEGRETLREARAEWRRLQVAVVVRDAPETAAAELADLGYTVAPPADGHPLEKASRLTEH